MICFANSSIEEISIPSSVVKIAGFNDCKKLKKVFIPLDSNLEKIDDFAFSNSAISSIIITSKVSMFGNKAFYNCKFLKVVEFMENSNLKSIDLSIFTGSKPIIYMPLSLSKILKKSGKIV